MAARLEDEISPATLANEAIHMSTSNTVPGANNPINGTSSGEYIGDTDAHDVVKAGDGNDTIFLGGKGDDIVDGEGGSYNQVDLRGRASDYVFKRNSDGTITVSSAATGTDTLKNINGFYFYGEGKWYGANDLAPLVVTPPAMNRITGTAASEMLSDTNANDVIKAGEGNDTIFLGGKGDDIVDGEGGNYNQVDLRGSASDYTFKRNSDGTISVSSAATGTDKLKNINGFYFYGDGKWYSAEQLAPSNGGPAAPDAIDDAFSGQKDVVVTGNLGANDKVAPGDIVTFSVFKQPANGTVTINADGTFTYVPKAGFVGTDTFLYDIKNAAGSVDCATVTIEVKQPPAPQKTASLGDRVWLDANKNGIQDTGEQGVAGVTVQLKDANGNVIATKQTDAAGNYLFDKLAAGSYSVNVVKPGQYDFTTRDAGTDDTKDSDSNTSGATGSYTLKDGDAVRTVDIGLIEKPVEPVKTASIGDYVWRDLSKDGQQQAYAGEVGFGGITVNLKDANGNIIATTTTNAGGYYLFDKLAAGNYSLQFIRPDGYEFTKQDIGDDRTDSDANASGQTGIISLKEGEAIRTVDAGLVAKVVEPPKTGSIGDRVWLDTNKDGMQTGGEQGVAGVTVQLRDVNGTVIATQQTDANGNYLFDKLAAGNYTVTVVKPGQYDFTAQDVGPNEVNSDFNSGGSTGTIGLAAGQHIRTIDAGLVTKYVPPVNKPPVAVDDQGKVKCADKNGININVLANDSDPDGNALTAVLKTQPSNGTVTQNADGTMHYQPRAGFEGTDSFTYTVSDGKGGTSSATVRVEVEQPIKVQATIVGADQIVEGAGKQQDYRVQLDKAVDKDTYYTVRVFDGSATWSSGTEATSRENLTGITKIEQYGIKGDISTYKDGQATGRDIVVKVAAGQTSSEAFQVKAWQENQILTVYNTWNSDPSETFKLGITNIQGSGNCEIISPSEKTVSIKDVFYNNGVSPIALDLDGSGAIEVTGETSSHQKDDFSVGKTVQFDIDADGDVDTVEWFKGAGDGILVNMAKIGPNGEINGEALFGDQGGKFANGYAKLAGFDANGDAMISGDELKGLGLWVDNGDAVLQDGELRSAAEFGIASISTDMSIAYDAKGRELMQSFALTADGEKILTEDVWFSQDDQDHQPAYHQIAA